MDARLTRHLCATPEEVRRTIAYAVLGAPAAVHETVGSITLRPRQRSAAARCLSVIQRMGGALLAEPVGLGKTYTALAVAREAGGRAAIVAPAALRDMWRQSLAATALDVPLMTHEALSRGASTDWHYDFIIVDEAHRFRAPDTRRYALLADRCRTSRVLLLSATPIHNRREDLVAQLALFAGRRAWSMSDDELIAYVVRESVESDGDHLALPHLEGPRAIQLSGVDDGVVDALLALPAPAPARDESVAPTLLLYGLVHQWSSSRGALAAALARRRTRGLALLDVLQSGRVPSRSELAAWQHGGDSVQLAFPELIVAPPTGATSIEPLRTVVTRHLEAIECLLNDLRRRPDPDAERAQALRALRATHPGARIVAFCHYAETVAALRRHLSSDPGVATLTARGARIAGGAIARGEVLRQFSASPGPDGNRWAKRIDLLLTTDLLSEGVNLQGASVIVHLDLPWNPARLEQRVGRARRLGSPHDVVFVYQLEPPASADRLLEIRRRLTDKLAVAHRAVGPGLGATPSPQASTTVSPASLADQTARLRAVLGAWLGSGEPVESMGKMAAGHALVAAVRSEQSGFFAAVRFGDRVELMCELGGELRTDTSALLAAMALGTGASSPIDTARLNEASTCLARWIETQRAAHSLDLHAATSARGRRGIASRMRDILHRAPRHDRARIAALVNRARAAITAPMAEGAERLLESLAHLDHNDESWLRAVADFSAANARQLEGQALPGARQGTVVAILLLQPHPADR